MSERWSTWSVGDRVVVRRRLPPGDATDHLYTDVLGVVLAVDAGGITLRPDAPRASPREAPVPHDGSHGSPEEVRIDAADITLGKRVPPRPVRRPAG